MSDDLLYLSINNSPKISKGMETGGKLGEIKTSQAIDFKRILKSQMGKKESGVTKEESPDAKKNTSVEVGSVESDDLINPAVNGPFLETSGQSLGNTLPSLTIHHRALEVGRVILTTADSLVNERSLSAFVRRQGQLGAEAPVDAEQLQPAQSGFSQNVSLSGIRGNADLDSNKSGVDGPQDGPEERASLFEFSKGKIEQFLTRRELESALPSGEKDALVLVNGVQTKKGVPGIGISEGALMRLQSSETQRLLRPDGRPLKSIDDPAKSNKKSLSPLEQKIELSGSPKSAQIEGELLNVEGKSQSPKSIDEMEFSTDEMKALEKSSASKSEKSFEVMKNLAVREVAQPHAESIKLAPTVRVAIESPEVVGLEGRSASMIEPEFRQELDTGTRPVIKETLRFGDALTSKPEVRDSFLRTEQYLNWSQRFGEVLGQRLSLALKQGSWNVKLNLNPSSLGPIDVSLEIGEKGIEGQINSSDPAARQLLQDSLSRLKSTLAELYDQGEEINLSLGDKEKSGSESEKADNSTELLIDLLAEEFALEDGQPRTVNGLDLFV